MRGYTLAQFNAYLREAQRMRRQDLSAQILAVGLGMSGGDAVRKAIGELDKP